MQSRSFALRSASIIGLMPSPTIPEHMQKHPSGMSDSTRISAVVVVARRMTGIAAPRGIAFLLGDSCAAAASFNATKAAPASARPRTEKIPAAPVDPLSSFSSGSFISIMPPGNSYGFTGYWGRFEQANQFHPWQAHGPALPSPEILSVRARAKIKTSGPMQRLRSDCCALDRLPAVEALYNPRCRQLYFRPCRSPIGSSRRVQTLQSLLAQRVGFFRMIFQTTQ